MRSYGLRLAIAGVALAALSACAILGVPSPQNFSERMASAYTAVTTARAGGLVLLQAHEITPEQMDAATVKLDQLRGGLDLADRVHRTDAQAGEDRLLRILNAVAQVQECVDVGKPNFAGCIERVPITEESSP